MSIPAGKIGVISNDSIDVELQSIGVLIQRLIADVSKLRVVSKGDLTVYMQASGGTPTTIMQAIQSGTRLFDAIYYFSAPDNSSITLQPHDASRPQGEAAVALMKKYLLWMFLFVMMRGSYPKSQGTARGTDVPSFLTQIVGMNVSPLTVSQGLCSFEIEKVPLGWLKTIKFGGMAPEIRQRLALGLPGYRMFGPFRFYLPRPDASAEAKAAHAWVVRIINKPLDWGLFSATRDPAIITRLGSLNKNLSNLMIECFTHDQLVEMASPAVKIIFEVPTRDPRGDGWRSWVQGGDLELNDPIDFLTSA